MEPTLAGGSSYYKLRTAVDAKISETKTTY
jgi:hypothetical protein